MTDKMTREEAIKILRIRKEYATLIKEDVLQDAIDLAIEALSDRPTDEWCTDCKEYDHEKHCCPRFNRVIRTTLNEAVANLKEEFESADAEQVTGKLKNPCDSLLTDDSAECKEQKSKLESADAVHGWRIGKPTEQGKYMVTLDSFGHKRIDLFYYGKPLMPNRKVRGKCWYRSDDEWGDVVYDDTDILAWQPLPTPYKGGAE